MGESVESPARQVGERAYVAESLAAGLLHLILLPTEGCNFRCTYCYETFEHGRMARGVVEGVKHLLSRRAQDLSHLTLTWFGGEPLLALDIVEEVMQHARSLARERPSLTLTSDITTNAYFLTPDVWLRLIDLGVVRYQISFDGPRASHDRVRRLAGGAGTFDRIWGHLIAMRETSAEFAAVIRLHVCPDNEAALSGFVDDFHDAFGADRRFEVFIRKLEQLGGPNDGSTVFFGKEDGNAAVARIAEHARLRGVRHKRTSDLGGVCYASRANSFVVRADGRINKCTVALERAENQVGRLREDGTIELNTSRMIPWMRGLLSGDAGELACPLDGMEER